MQHPRKDIRTLAGRLLSDQRHAVALLHVKGERYAIYETPRCGPTQHARSSIRGGEWRQTYLHSECQKGILEKQPAATITILNIVSPSEHTSDFHIGYHHTR